MTARFAVCTIVLLVLALPAIALFAVVPIYGCNVGYGMDGCGNAPKALLSFSVWGLLTFIPASIFFVFYVLYFGVGGLMKHLKRRT
jgi:hypothetical protein